MISGHNEDKQYIWTCLDTALLGSVRGSLVLIDFRVEKTTLVAGCAIDPKASQIFGVQVLEVCWP